MHRGHRSRSSRFPREGRGTTVQACLPAWWRSRSSRGHRLARGTPRSHPVSHFLTLPMDDRRNKSGPSSRLPSSETSPSRNDPMTRSSTCKTSSTRTSAGSGRWSPSAHTIWTRSPGLSHTKRGPQKTSSSSRSTRPRNTRPRSS